jgi:hypothetical protein
MFLSAEALAVMRTGIAASSVLADPASHWLFADTTKL